jgi:octaprenyl-diphosphate synthase
LSSEDYFKIITFKTAELMSAACASPALLVGAGTDTTKALSEFGINMGIAFQLIDDLLDYTSSEGIFGKPVGKDLKEGKITLPLLYTLEESKVADRDLIVKLIGDEPNGQRDYDYVIEMVRRDGSLDRVYSEAGEYSRRAAECLGIFPSSPSKDSLLEINDYIIERSY